MGCWRWCVGRCEPVLLAGTASQCKVLNSSLKLGHLASSQSSRVCKHQCDVHRLPDVVTRGGGCMWRPGVPGLHRGVGGGPRHLVWEGNAFTRDLGLPAPSSVLLAARADQQLLCSRREPELGSGGCEDPVGSWAWFRWTPAGLSPACYVPPAACTARDRASLQSRWAPELPDPTEPSFSCPGAGSLPGGALWGGPMPGAWCPSLHALRSALHQLLKHLEFLSGLSGSVVLKTCGAAC